jgi:hypothetical protein
MLKVILEFATVCSVTATLLLSCTCCGGTEHALELMSWHTVNRRKKLPSSLCEATSLLASDAAEGARVVTRI